MGSKAVLAQLGERQTEDLEVLCSIHRNRIFFLLDSMATCSLLFFLNYILNLQSLCGVVDYADLKYREMFVTWYYFSES